MPRRAYNTNTNINTGTNNNTGTSTSFSIVSPSGHPPTLSDRRSSDSYLSVVLLPPCEALVVGLEVRSEAAQTLENCGAPKARWEVIVGAPKASWELN